MERGSDKKKKDKAVNLIKDFQNQWAKHALAESIKPPEKTKPEPSKKPKFEPERFKMKKLSFERTEKPKPEKKIESSKYKADFYPGKQFEKKEKAEKKFTSLFEGSRKVLGGKDEKSFSLIHTVYDMHEIYCVKENFHD